MKSTKNKNKKTSTVLDVAIEQPVEPVIETIVADVVLEIQSQELETVITPVTPLDILDLRVTAIQDFIGINTDILLGGDYGSLTPEEIYANIVNQVPVSTTNLTLTFIGTTQSTFTFDVPFSKSMFGSIINDLQGIANYINDVIRNSSNSDLNIFTCEWNTTSLVFAMSTVNNNTNLYGTVDNNNLMGTLLNLTTSTFARIVAVDSYMNSNTLYGKINAINALLPNKMNIVASPTVNNIITMDANGQSLNSGVKIQTGGLFNPLTNWIANNKIISDYINQKIVSGSSFIAAYDASSNLFPTTGGTGVGGSIAKGNYWVIIISGTLGGEIVSIGDYILAVVDNPGQTVGIDGWFIQGSGTIESITGSSNYFTVTIGGTPSIPNIDIDASIATAGTYGVVKIDGTNLINSIIGNDIILTLIQNLRTTDSPTFDSLVLTGSNQIRTGNAFVKFSKTDNTITVIASPEVALQFLTGINNNGAFTKRQPNFADLTGQATNSQTSATSANTPSTIVLRDGSGNFIAGTITANLTGTASGNQLRISNPTNDNLVFTDSNGQTIDSGFSIQTTGALNNSTTQLANNKTISDAIANAITDGGSFIGGYDASSNLFPATGSGGNSIKKGNYWEITVGGTLGGTVVSQGDTILALVNTPGQTISNWNITTNKVNSVNGLTGTVLLALSALIDVLISGSTNGQVLAYDSATQKWKNITLLFNGVSGNIAISQLPNGNVNGNSQLVQLTAAGKYPALDGSLITNLPSSGYSYYANYAALPTTSVVNGTVAVVINTTNNAGTTYPAGLWQYTTSWAFVGVNVDNATLVYNNNVLQVNVGTAANNILQLNSTSKIPAVSSELTTIGTLPTLTNTTIADDDSINALAGKTQGQINALLPLLNIANYTQVATTGVDGTNINLTINGAISKISSGTIDIFAGTFGIPTLSLNNRVLNGRSINQTIINNGASANLPINIGNTIVINNLTIGANCVINFANIANVNFTMNNCIILGTVSFTGSADANNVVTFNNCSGTITNNTANNIQLLQNGSVYSVLSWVNGNAIGYISGQNNNVTTIVSSNSSVVSYSVQPSDNIVYVDCTNGNVNINLFHSGLLGSFINGQRYTFILLKGTNSFTINVANGTNDTINGQQSLLVNTLYTSITLQVTYNTTPASLMFLIV